MKRLIVEIVDGRLRGTRRVLTPGSQLTIGRTDKADLAIANDKQLSGVHLTLVWDGHACTMTSELGVLVGGEGKREGVVEHGSWIRAGGTELMVFHEAATPATEDDEVDEELKAARDEALASLEH